MDIRLALLFIGLGSTAGTFLGMGTLAAFFDYEAFKFGGYMITAGATLAAATFGAYMIKHQLAENYRNQRKLEKIKYISNQETINKLKTLDKVLTETNEMIPIIGGKMAQANLYPSIDTEADLKQALRLFRKKGRGIVFHSEVLPPLSWEYYSKVATIGYVTERKLDLKSGPPFLTISEKIKEVQTQIAFALAGNYDCHMFDVN